MSAESEENRPEADVPFPVTYIRGTGFDETPIEAVQPLAQPVSMEYKRTPEAQAKGAQRRAKREQKNRAERIKPLAYNLKQERVCGVTAVRGAVTADLITGLGEKFGTERILQLPAEGTIQGEDKGFAYYIKVAKQISKHWRAHQKAGLLLFDGTNFDGNAGRGTELLFKRISDITSRQKEVTGKKNNDMMFLFLGHESLRDVPNPYQSNEGAAPVLEHIAVNYRLQKNGDLISAVQPSEFAEYTPPAVNLTVAALEAIKEDYEEAQ